MKFKFIHYERKQEQCIIRFLQYKTAYVICGKFPMMHLRRQLRMTRDVLLRFYLNFVGGTYVVIVS